MISIEIKGADAIRRKLNKPIHADPIARALERAGAAVESEAKRLASVDRGVLRAKITHRLDASPRPRFVQVGLKLNYARPVHFGRRAGAKMPPAGALTGWLRRHGIPADREFIIRRAIARRGIRPRPFLTDALSRVRDTVEGWLRRAGAEIEAEWKR